MSVEHDADPESNVAYVTLGKSQVCVVTVPGGTIEILSGFRATSIVVRDDSPNSLAEIRMKHGEQT